MREVAFAKLNLALHVRGRMDDGYHAIETLFAFAEDGDVLEVEEGERLELRLTGPFADRLTPGRDNLVMRAAQALAERGGVSRGGSLILDKRLPVAAGIGGGSADAAAALRLLDRWWQLDLGEEPLLEIAAGLGADVPACLLSCTARGEGKGDRLVRVDAPELAGVPVLLVHPGIPLATADMFRAWDGRDRGPLVEWRDGRNDLQPAALAAAPEIGEALSLLADAAEARMSGSGATCFALYANGAERDSAAERIRAARPDWWLLPSRLR